jgi:hypothetical protein
LDSDFRFKSHFFEESLAARPNFAFIGNVDVVVVTARDIQNPLLNFVIGKFKLREFVFFSVSWETKIFCCSNIEAFPGFRENNLAL